MILFVCLALAGCSRSDQNSAPPTPTDAQATPGASWSNYVKELLEAAIVSYTSDKPFGWAVAVFLSGQGGDDVDAAIQYVEQQLQTIEKDLNTIIGELQTLQTEVAVDTDKIIAEEEYAMISGAISTISNQYSNMQALTNNYKPGSEEAEKAANSYACSFLDPSQYDIDQQLFNIYQIMVNYQDVDPSNGGILQNVTKALIGQLSIATSNSSSITLSSTYQTLESFFNKLLQIQMQGAVLYIEALHARDNVVAQGGYTFNCPAYGYPGTAEQWFNEKFLGQIASEVDMFLSCVDQLVVSQADLRTNIGLPLLNSANPSEAFPSPFLPGGVDAVFSRADFIAAQMAPEYHSFGVVVRTVGEPDSITAYTNENQPPQINGQPMTLTKLGVPYPIDQTQNYRDVQVTQWNNWPQGANQAYMQWNWFAFSPLPGFGDWAEYNQATDVFVAMYAFNLESGASQTNAILDWNTTPHEEVEQEITLFYLNDTMEEDPKGHPWAHATLPVRHRPTAWQRPTPDNSYTSDYISITDTYVISNFFSPLVEITVAIKDMDDCEEYQDHFAYKLNSGLYLIVVSGMSEQEQILADVQMAADAGGDIGNGNDYVACWWADDSAASKALEAGQDKTYTATVSHTWNPGDAHPFNFNLHLEEDHVDCTWQSDGTWANATLYAGSVYLYFSE